MKKYNVNFDEIHVLLGFKSKTSKEEVIEAESFSDCTAKVRAKYGYKVSNISIKEVK